LISSDVRQLFCEVGHFGSIAPVVIGLGGVPPRRSSTPSGSMTAIHAVFATPVAAVRLTALGHNRT
jgi:hypothetical protein